MSYSLRNSPYTSPVKRPISPLHHLKSPGYFMTTTPPQNITIKKTSINPQQQQQFTHPGRDISPPKVTEADLWKSRCNDLETSLCQANTDLELAQFKAKKTKELETRVDLILKQNSQLLSENDNVQKSFNQKKTESDIWRSKYESQMNTIIQMKANYELELKKQNTDNTRMKLMLDTTCVEKYKEVEDTKGRMFMESSEKVEHLKRSHAKNASLYEEQLNKMKDIIEERDREIEELQYKLNLSRNDGEVEQSRLNEDRDKLRYKYQQLEHQVSNELELQREKIEGQFNDQIESMKALHRSRIETLETELRKLNNLIDAKNSEIQTLIIQNKNQKNNFDADSSELRFEVQALKDKIAENNIIKEEEVNILKEKLATLHIADSQQLKERHESLENGLRVENENLQQILGSKSEELDNQIMEKHQQFQSYQKESLRLKEESENLRYRYSLLEKEREKQLAEANNHLQKNNQTQENFCDQLKNQILFLEHEIDELKFQLVKKNNELDENIAKSKAIKSTLEDDIRHLKVENEEWKSNFYHSQQEKEKNNEDNRQKSSLQEGNFIEKVRKLETHLDNLEIELRRNNEALFLKSEECVNHQAHRQQQDVEIKKLKVEIDALGDQILYLEQLKAKELDEQRIRFIKTSHQTETTLKDSYNNQINVLNQEIATLKHQLDIKQREIEDMIHKYEQIEGAFGDFRENADRLQDYEKSIQQLGAEIVTTKNLYDVFVKTKSRFQRK